MNNPIIMHVNYMEPGQSIEIICRKAVEWGYDGVEFRRGKIGFSQEEYLDAIAKGTDASGLKHVLFGFGPELMLDNESERKKSLNEAISFLEMATSRFKLSVCNVFAGTLLDKSIEHYMYDKHGSAMATEKQWEWAAEGFRILGDMASKAGFKMAFETHMHYIHDLHTSARKLVDMINLENVGINLDYCNMLYFPEHRALGEVIETCGDKIYHVHLKNILKVQEGVYNSSIRCSLADGIVNNREFLRILLKEKAYTGPIALESPRQGDREWFAQEDIRYIKEVIKDIRGEDYQ